MPARSATPAAFALLLLLSACAAPAPMTAPPDVARIQLAEAERAWLDAYDTDDRAFMARVLADGFTITFPNGHVDTKADVIAGLDPDGPDDGDEPGPTHYTEDRTIRIIGTTAILSGVYVNPGDDGRPDSRMRYTDTWMWLDGRWQVVASHLSAAGD